MYIIDRRLNAGGKSLPNRQRFLRRAKALVQRAVADKAAERDITDIDSRRRGRRSRRAVSASRASGARIPAAAGLRVAGKQEVRRRGYDRAPAWLAPDAGPRRAMAKAKTSFDSCSRAKNSCSFFSTISIFPILPSGALMASETVGMRRAGYSVTGSPPNLALTRTMRNSLSRRIALKRPGASELAEPRGGDCRTRKARAGKQRPARIPAQPVRRVASAEASRFPTSIPSISDTGGSSPCRGRSAKLSCSA